MSFLKILPNSQVPPQLTVELVLCDSARPVPRYREEVATRVKARVQHLRVWESEPQRPRRSRRLLTRWVQVPGCPGAAQRTRPDWHPASRRTRSGQGASQAA